MNKKIASFNYTNRRRIRREDVLISGSVEDGETKIVLERLDLAALSLPDESEVFLEITSNRKNMRFPIGFVNGLQIGNPINLGGAPIEGVTAKVKVVGRSTIDKGKLLAVCDRLRPEFPNGSQSILPLVSADLGDLVWRLDIDSETGPELQINNRFNDLYAVYRNPLFLSTVMPEVVRQIAFWALQCDVAIEDSVAEIHDEWIYFFKTLGHDVKLKSGDVNQASDLAHQIALDFSRKNRYLDLFKTTLEIQD